MGFLHSDIHKLLSVFSGSCLCIPLKEMTKLFSGIEVKFKGNFFYSFRTKL